jgi:glycosyltransferase involved in cell wall biosynthesis
MTADAERPLRVALDATSLRGPLTGVGQFCAQLLRELAPRPGLKLGAFAVSRAGRAGIAGRLPAGVELLGWPGPGIPARLLHSFWARAAFPTADMLYGSGDVVHGTNFVVPPAKGATVVSVHDLTPLHYPQWCPPAARAYPGLVRAAVRRGAWVHTDSASVAQEVVEWLGLSPERVVAVHLGVRGPFPGPGAPIGTPATDGWRRLLPDWVGSYVLALSTVEPRKDFPGLVRAFAQLAGTHPGLALVLAGPDGGGTPQLNDVLAACPARDRVVRLGWVSEVDRDALLAGATVFAYPSRYEGFGLPPLEAMAAGAPVVATRCGALEEVLGDAARLVEVGDETALAAALAGLVDDPEARQDLSRRGRERAARFSWSACADGLEALYRRAAGAA